MFWNVRSNNEKAVQSSFVIAQKITQTTKPYSDRKFVKQYLTDVTQEMCRKMVTEFEKTSLSLWTMTPGLSTVLLMISLTDQNDTTQLAIFVKEVDKELKDREELLSVQSTNNTTRADTFDHN